MKQTDAEMKQYPGSAGTDMEDRLDEEMIRSSAHGITCPVYVFDEIGSTNTFAKKLASEGAPHGTLAVADSQSAGRGRHGHTFHSPKGTGLYLSLLIRPLDLSPAQVSRIAPAAAVAAYEAIREVSGISCGIKWVNDLYLGRKKTAGILCEAVSDHGKLQAVVIGIGINWRTMSFPDELKDKAGSFCCDGIPRSVLAGVLWEKLLQRTSALDDPGMMDVYRERSVVIGKEIEFMRDGSLYTAFAKGISDEGSLVIEKPDGTEEILKSGEISVKTREI